MSEEHPLDRMLADWLPEFDFAVLSHGFPPNGRDYVLVLQAAGTFELTLTHVVDLQYETRVVDQVWSSSWEDSFTEYSTWEASGEPEGYVWGTNWSLAYPGLTLLRDDAAAASWSHRLGRTMHAVALETDRFKMRLVFHSARDKRLSDDQTILDQVIVP